jgi:hypothetical protein
MGLGHREERIMSTMITAPQDRAATPRDGAGSRDGAAPRDGERYAPAIELRLLCAHEARLVRRLAALDDAPALRGQILIALIGGQAVAALSLLDQRVVANPFLPTAESVALLRLRAGQLANGGTRSRFRRLIGDGRRRKGSSGRSGPPPSMARWPTR